MKLATNGFRPALTVLQDQVKVQGRPDFIIPHSFSDTVPTTVAQRIGLEDRIQNFFKSVGNISTSSIPFGLWQLSRNESIENKNVIGWVASAGMKHAAFKIEWVPFS